MHLGYVAGKRLNLYSEHFEMRNQKRSTALVTNVDFEKWGDYLADGPLAMAFLDRLVEGAIILKVKGKSYRAPQANGGEDKPA
jgi:DNA replication protein DnaC